MIFTHDLPCLRALAFAALLTLAACGDAGDEATPFEQAQQALAQGDGVLAEVTLRQMLADGTSLPEVAPWLGEAELQQGQLVEARHWLGEGKFAPEAQSHGFHMLGRLEMAEGNLPAAGQAFDRALAATPEEPELWVDIGRLRYRGGEQLQAVDASLRALEFGSDNPEALRFRAQLLRDAEGMEAALPLFARALERNPGNVGLLVDYAATLGEAGRAKDMLVAVREAAKRDPGNRDIYYLQAVLAARADNFALAQSLLQRAGRDERDLPAALMLSGVIDIENGNYASAAQTLDRLASLQPDNRRAQLLLARALSLGRNDRELVHRFGEAARGSTASPYLQMIVARSLEALDRRDEAAVLIDLAQNPVSGNLVAIPAATTLGVAEVRGGSSGPDTLALVRARIVARSAGGAVAAAEQFVKRYPGSADALVLAGDANLAARNNGGAIARYEAAARIRRPWPVTRKLAKALVAGGRVNDAIALVAAHLVGDPANVEAARLLAEAAAARRDWPSAAIFADHALANGGNRDPALLALRAQIALGMGDGEGAMAYASRAYGLQRQNPQAIAALVAVNRQSEGGAAAAQALDAKLRTVTRSR